MPLDPNIILGIRPPQFDNPMDVANKAMTMKRLALENREAEDAMSSKRAIKDAYRKNVAMGPDGKPALNRSGVISDLYNADPMTAMEQEESFTAKDAAARKAKFEELETQSQIAKTLAWQIDGPESYMAARQKGIDLGLPNAESLPPQYPGDDFIKQMKMRTLSVTEQLARQKAEEDFGRELKKQTHQGKITRQNDSHKAALDRGASTLDHTEQKELKLLENDLAMGRLAHAGKQRLAELQAKNSTGGGLASNLSEGEKSADKEYGKDFVNYTKSGRTNAINTIEKLDALANEVDAEGDGLFAPGGTRLPIPDMLRQRKSIEWRDDARNFANKTLKELFGGQLSDKEREAAAKEYWNDSLDNASNVKRIRGKIKELRDNVAAQDAQAAYYRDNRTLRGFQYTPTEQASFDPDVQAYARKHGISPEQAAQIKAQRTQSAGR